MNWLKHIVLVVAATVMVAAPATSCCLSGHANAAVVGDARVAVAPESQVAAGMPAAHDCGDAPSGPITQAGAHEPAPAQPQPDDDCPGCADCAVVTAQSKAGIAAIEARGDHQPEYLIGAAAIAVPVRHAVTANLSRPSATAPPPKSPVSLRQRLIV